MSEAAERIEKLQGVAVRVGYRKEDLKTTSFDVQTRYENVKDRQGNYKREFAGYACSYRLKLAFDFDSKQLAKVISAIADCGAQPELSIAFTVKNPARVSEELLNNATENARAKAEILCKASGSKAKLTILKEAARTLNYLTENNLLQYADLEKKVEDVHGSYDRTGKELKGVEARLREVQPLIKNISNYQRLKPVYDAFQKAKDKPGFKAKHEAELVIFEAARSTLLAMQGDEKLPSLKTLQAEQQRLLEEQQRLYDERAKLKKEAKHIETIKSNVDTFLAPSVDHDRDHLRSTQRE